jgi:lipopolysaccharide/colanic/teichoic acid biosynthesis glycosyltransferase
MLMLLDAEQLFRDPNGADPLQRVVSALASSTRETDVSGWYANNAILGVIFTEIGDGEKSTIAEAVLTRVTSALQQSLDADQMRKLSISLCFYPEQWDGRTPKLPVSSELYPDLFRNGAARMPSRFLKRTMDVLGSIVALITLAPLFGLIAVLIKLTSQGPILFRQRRVGLYGSTFEMLKFRSMSAVNDPNIHKEYVERFIAGRRDSHPAGDHEPPVYKMTRDPRVTPLGGFLRRTSLDELPQFWNVVKGEMSLVGPRPPIPYELNHYDVWHRRRLVEAKPGITGLWQVFGRSKTTFDEMVRLDLEYAKTQSLWLDVKILLRTPRVVLSGQGGY